jgi:hypothetical protein
MSVILSVNCIVWFKSVKKAMVRQSRPIPCAVPILFPRGIEKHIVRTSERGSVSSIIMALAIMILRVPRRYASVIVNR